MTIAAIEKNGVMLMLNAEDRMGIVEARDFGDIYILPTGLMLFGEFPESILDDALAIVLKSRGSSGRFTVLPR